MPQNVSQKPFPVVLGAIVVAVALWISVNMQEEYSVVKNVPVVFEEMREGKALRFPIPKMMSIRVRGSGWVAARLFLSPDVRYFINLSSVTTEPVLITAREAQNHVTLPANATVLDVKPETLRVALADYHEKRVPVSPRVVLEFRDGYGQVGTWRLAPDSVTIGGTLEYLRGVERWGTDFRRYSDVRAPIDEDIALEESQNYALAVSARSVRLNVNVEPFAEKVFPGIPLSVTGVPSGREVIFIPPRMDLVIRGGIEQLSALQADRFAAEVSYDALERDSTGYVVPMLKIPDGVKAVERRPPRFQFIIRKRL